MSSQFRQDMPPPGGYSPVRWARVAQRTSLTGWGAAVLYIICTSYGYIKFDNWRQYLKKLDVEKFDAFCAMQPFVEAEKDRLFLNNLRRLREDERELMKDHPGWVVGTLYGEPLYKTVAKSEMPDLHVVSFYMHRPFKSCYEYAWPDQWA